MDTLDAPNVKIPPTKWIVPPEQRNMAWKPDHWDEWNPQYRPPVAMTLCLRFFQHNVLYVEELLAAKTIPHEDLLEDGTCLALTRGLLLLS